MRDWSKLKKPVIYCLAAAAVIAAVLLNLHNESYMQPFTPESMTLNEAAAVPNDTGLYTDDTSGYSGVFASSDWLFLPNFGTYTLGVAADTRGESNLAEIWISDGRGEECVASAPINPGSGTSSVTFSSKANVKYAQLRIVFAGEGYLTFRGAEIRSGLAYSDTFFAAGIAALLFLAVGLYWFLFRKRNAPGAARLWNMADCAVLLGVVYFVSQPSLLGYLFFAHDQMFHLLRIDAVRDALLAGQFPVRLYVSESLGYGYGAPLYYPDLFLYIPALFRMLGVSRQVSYQSFIIMINAATAFIAYYAAGRVFKDRFTALIAAVLYTSALYRLVNAYTRAAVGELLAMVFLPLIAAGLYEIFFGDARKWRMAAVGYAGVILSHILSVMMVLIFSVLFAAVFCVRIFRDGRWKALLKAAAAVVISTLWFIVPFIQMFVSFRTDFGAQRVTSYLMGTYLSQIFNVFVNAKGETSAAGGPVSGAMGKSLGLAVVFAVAALIIWFAVRERGKKYDSDERFSLAALAFGAVSVWMMTFHFPLRAVVESGSFGEIINRIQFPWRFLSIASLCFSFAGAVGISRLGAYLGNRRMLAAALSLAVAIPCGYYIFEVQDKGDPIYRPDVGSGFLMNYREYLPEGFTAAIEDIEARGGSPALSGSEMTVRSFVNSNKETVLSYAGGAGYADFPMVYYPGYTAVDADGKELKTSPGPEMYLRVELEESEGTVTVRYTGLKLWTVCNWASLLAVAVYVSFTVYKKKKLPREIAAAG